MNSNTTPQEEEESKDNKSDTPKNNPETNGLEKINLPDFEGLTPILKQLPENEQKEVIRTLVSMTYKRSWSGPLPDPKNLREYNDIIPNGAERIFNRSEKQSDHRMELEKLAVTTELRQSGRGQHYALTIALAFLIASFILIYTGHDISGTIIGTVDILGLVSVFIIGKYYQKEDLRNKNEDKVKGK